MLTWTIVGKPENAWTPQQERQQHQGPRNVGVLIADRSSAATGTVANSVGDSEPDPHVFGPHGSGSP